MPELGIAAIAKPFNPLQLAGDQIAAAFGLESGK